jgi:hypothetical protein
MASRARSLGWIALGLAGAAAVAAVAAVGLDATPATSAAWAGAALQVGGLVTVAVGIRKLRRKYNQPGVLAQAYGAVRDRVNRLRAKPRNIVLHAEAGDYALVGEEVEAILKAGPETPIERRVEILEGEQERLRERVGRDRERVTRLDDAVTRERAERTSADDALAEAHRDLAAGGLDLQTVGLVWLVAGVVLGTLPGPIAAALCLLLGGS